MPVVGFEEALPDPDSWGTASGFGPPLFVAILLQNSEARWLGTDAGATVPAGTEVQS